MAKRKSDQAAAETMAALDRLRYEPDAAKKKLDAWRLLVAAAGLRDFGVLHDFALEHELIRSGEDGEKMWVNPIDGSQMIWIPGGAFFIGSDRRRVECAGFSMARYPVTSAQFSCFLERDRVHTAGESSGAGPVVSVALEGRQDSNEKRETSGRICLTRRCAALL